MRSSRSRNSASGSRSARRSPRASSSASRPSSTGRSCSPARPPASPCGCPTWSRRTSWLASSAIGLHEVAYAVGWTAWLDLNPEGVSKGSALELLRRRLHVEPADTVAVGDQRNDIEMLQWAARGVAMGNAPERGPGGRRRGHRHGRGGRPGAGAALAALMSDCADALITSPSNPRLKTLLALRRRRARDAAGQTLVEGFDELRLALAGGVVPRTLYVCPELFSPSGYAGTRPSDARTTSSPGARGGLADRAAEPCRVREGRLPRGARRAARRRAPSASAHLDDAGRAGAAAGPRRRGRGEAGQPRGDAADRGCRRRGRGRRGRRGDRLGQPQRDPREQGDRVHRAGRAADLRGDGGAGAGTRHTASS